MRKSGFACLAMSARPMPRTRSQASRSRKEMKSASEYSKSMSESLRQKTPGGAAEPRKAGAKPLRVAHAALLAPVPRGGLHLVDDVDAVVVAEPRELALVGLEHGRLRLDHFG